MANGALLAILNMEKSKAWLIAANDGLGIRKSAVAVIKAASALDENIQRLDAAMHTKPEVQELLTLLESIKPVQQEIIQLAKENKDQEALDKTRESLGSINRINELVTGLVESETAAFNQKMDKLEALGRKVILAMGNWLQQSFC